jgi:hypothetical protein
MYVQDDIYSNKIKELEDHINNLKAQHKRFLLFNNRYAAFINDSDGIFGLFSDEIVVNILSYLPDKMILDIVCKRFYALRIDALKLRAAFRLRNIPAKVIELCKHQIYRSELKFYYKISAYPFNGDVLKHDHAEFYKLSNTITKYTVSENMISYSTSDFTVRYNNNTLEIVADGRSFHIDKHLRFIIDNGANIMDGTAKFNFDVDRVAKFYKGEY